MSSTTSDIDISIFDDVASLEWKARMLAQGLLLGSHRSQKLGSGMEFNQYRAYTQGDDLRLLDWKMYAKTGKYFVRQSNIESNQHLHVILDDSRSMDYREQGYSKFELAKLMTAALTYVIAQQQDNCSWQAGTQLLPKGHGLKHWRRSLLELSSLVTAHAENIKAVKNNYNGMQVWITDLYMDLDELDKYLDILNGPKRELVVMHIIGRDEEELSFSNNTKFIDLESGAEVQVNIKQFAQSYKDVLGDHVHKAKRLCAQKSAIYKKVYLDDDVAITLRNFIVDYNQLSVV